MDAATEAELIRRVTETHVVVHEKVVPWLDELNGTVRAVNTRQAQQDGALGMLRWIVITGIAVGGIVFGYVFTQVDQPTPVQIEVVPMEQSIEGGE